MTDREREALPSERTPSKTWIGSIVLVSSSPRRQAILRQIGIPFRVFEPEVDESADESDPPIHAMTVARRKLEAYLAAAPERQEWALAADTIVLLGRRIIGKPADRNEARQILTTLSGREHTVITAVAVYNPANRGVVVDTASTTVVFARLDAAEIEGYLATDEWKDVAGGYRIQERGGLLIESIRGSFTNVVGLPIRTFYGMVSAQGFSLLP